VQVRAAGKYANNANYANNLDYKANSLSN